MDPWIGVVTKALINSVFWLSQQPLDVSIGQVARGTVRIDACARYTISQQSQSFVFGGVGGSRLSWRPPYLATALIYIRITAACLSSEYHTMFVIVISINSVCLLSE